MIVPTNPVIVAATSLNRASFEVATGMMSIMKNTIITASAMKNLKSVSFQVRVISLVSWLIFASCAMVHLSPQSLSKIF